MAITNVMVESNQVEKFAVCCTADIRLESINRFFAATQRLERQEGAPPSLALIHSLEARYWGPTREIRSDDTDTLPSPFADATSVQIHKNLVQLKEDTGSSLNTEWFLILDRASNSTSSAVIVHVSEGGQSKSVRVEYAPSSRYLASASIGHPGLDQLIEIAGNTTDGILRDG